ncbi:MAG: sugar phosphate isomerase/epimerase family protein [Phycisphaerales bacterium]
MDRRTFIASTLAASALGFARVGHARPTRAPRGIRMSLKFGMIGVGDTIEQKFAAARNAGFDGVELDSPNDLNLEEVLDARKATGIAIPGVVGSRHWSHPLSSPDASVREAGLAALEQGIRDCKAYGGSTVLLVPAVVSAQVAYDEAYRRSQEEIRKVLPLAEQSGARVAIENVWNNFLMSPMEAARYIDEFESDAIGWYFDVGNIVNYGYPAQWARILGNRILKIDVKGFSRSKRDNEGLWKGFGVEIGEDDCDWPKVMHELDNIGYTGWASAEVGGGGADRLADIARRMRAVLDS